jgi:processive 1,2-diacylglycerol beta-glucosyltransferase
LSASLQQSEEPQRPVLILTISNGAGHIRTAQGLASAIRAQQPFARVLIADVADYMSPFARFTHVTAYLWIVKHAPAVWDRIDRYQKRQTHTSPEWFYRRGCRSLFHLARRVRPRALVATEVGCCEIGALIKRDLALDAPLVAVNAELDTDRAWVQPEVDLYCLVTEESGDELIAHGAPRERVVVWGATLAEGFDVPREHERERAEVCQWLSLEGRNARLKSRCERLAREGDEERLRVLGWTGAEQMAKLMAAADLMVSKLGSMFNEAIASALPIVALEPPPGAERIQYRLLEEWQVGRAVKTLEEMAATVADLLAHPQKLDALREHSRARRKLDAAPRIARWIDEAVSLRSLSEQSGARISVSARRGQQVLAE